MIKTKKLGYLSIVLIIALNILVYANTFKVPFQFDDVRYIQNNKDILGPLDIKSFLETFYLRGIVRWSFAVNYLIGELNTWGYHIVNLSMHITVSVLFFIILRNIYNNRRWNLPLLATLLFSLHPIQIESVTYIMSRSELFATFFYLLAFYFFVNSTRNISSNKVTAIVFLIATLICFFLGLGSKLTIVSLPIMLIVYLYTINAHNNNMLSITRKYKWPLLGVLIAFLLFIVRKSFSKHGLLGVSGMAIEQYGRWGYFMTEVKAFYLYYLKLLFLPFNLNINPDFPFSPSLWQTIFFLILIILGLIYSAKYLKTIPLLFFSVAWILITLSPTSSIIPLNDLVAEHRLYLPSLGFFLTTSLAIIEPKGLSEKAKTILIIFLVIVFSVLSVQQNSVWKNEVTLWEDAMKKSPFNRRSYHNLGRSYYYNNRLKEAITAYEKANEMNNFYFETHYNLGVSYMELGRMEKAIEEFKFALQLKRKTPETYINLGSVYRSQGKFEKAIKMFKQAIHFQKDCAVCFRNIAIIYHDIFKDYKKAKFYFQQTLRIDPEQNQKEKIQSILNSLDTF